MSKRVLWALVLIVLLILVLIFNHENVEVNLLVKKISVMKALVFLAFVVWGVAIGLLIK